MDSFPKRGYATQNGWILVPRRYFQVKKTDPALHTTSSGRGCFPPEKMKETKCHHRGGFYSEQLERILEHYPKEQVLVRDSQLDGENANWEVSDDFRSLCRVLFRAMCADQNSFLLCGP